MKARKFKLEIITEGAAFQGKNGRDEIARILDRMAERVLDEGKTEFYLFDRSGSVVGQATLKTVRVRDY